MKHTDLLLNNKSAVIFDIDGTLIDSMGIWKEIDAIYLSRYNIPMPANLQHELSGLSILQTADYFRDVLGVHETTEKMLHDWNDLAYYEYSQVVLPKAGAKAWLDTIRSKGLPMAVATSNTRKLACTALDANDLTHYFDVILTGEDVVKGKPDPYIYQSAAKKLSVDPAKCLVFEDIPAGLMAGLSAGMTVCGIDDTFSDYQLQEKRALAHYYIHSFEDIFRNQVEVLK